MRALALLLLAGCSDYNLEGPKDEVGTGGDDSGGGPGTDDTDVGDGDTDEDGECDSPDLDPGTVGVDASCDAPPVGTFTPVVEWNFAGMGGAYTTPVIGQLTDDNGNGALDAGDVPDIVVGAADGRYWALSGDGSGVHWTSQSYGGEPMTAAIGDLDGDGWNEVVVSGPSGTAALGGRAGTVVWSGRSVEAAQCGAVAIADMQGDGSPEVVIGKTIFNGQSGAVRARGQYGAGTGYSGGVYVVMGAVADVDLDGKQEAVVGNALYDADGTALWYNGKEDGFVAVADFDNDPEAEIVVAWTGRVRLQDTDGTVLWQGQYTGQTAGPPTVADFDGDGEPEIGVAGYGSYVVIETDGSVKWQQTTQDYSSGFTGSSVFDFEGDGAAEAVYADENDLFVYDGATGAIKLQEPAHSSLTCSEYPAIADVDNDGHAEIVYTSYAYTSPENGVTVVGDADDSWMAARPVWNQHAYSITNVEDLGGIPRSPAPNWATYNSFRSGDLAAATGGALTDAVVQLAEVCAVECDAGRLRVTVRLGNRGTATLPAEIDVSAYAVRNGAAVYLETQTTTAEVASGETSAGLVFDLDPAAVTEEGLLFVADDRDGAQQIAECDEDNNDLEVRDGLCP